MSPGWGMRANLSRRSWRLGHFRSPVPRKRDRLLVLIKIRRTRDRPASRNELRYALMHASTPRFHLGLRESAEKNCRPGEKRAKFGSGRMEAPPGQVLGDRFYPYYCFQSGYSNT